MAACSKTKPLKCFGSQDKFNLLNLLVVGLVSMLLMIKTADAQDAGFLERMEALESEFSDLKRAIAASLLASTEPCAELPGEWIEAQEFSGRFLLGAGDAYAAGSEGGEAAVALTLDEMPRHRHEVVWNSGHTISLNKYQSGPIPPNDNRYRIPFTKDGKPGNNMNTTFVGKGARHNNMPPYRVVFFCKLEAN